MASPLDAVAASLSVAVAFLQDRRVYARKRQAVIASHPELQEREQMKMARLSEALSGALRNRDVNETRATLAAEMGVAVLEHRSSAGLIAEEQAGTVRDNQRIA